MLSGKILGQKDDKEFNSYIAAILQGENETVILKSLSDLIVPSPYRVRVKVLYSPTSISEIFDRLDRKQVLSKVSDQARVYSYRTTVGRETSRAISTSFFVSSILAPDSDEKVQAVISVCRKDQWNVLMRLFRAQYPKLVPVLLSQTELIDSVKLLRRSSGHKVHVKSLSAKEWTEDKKRKSVREWTDEDLDKVIFNIRERRQLVTSLEVEFFQVRGEHAHVIPYSTCIIRKHGEIEVTGDFKLALNSVVKHVAQVGKKKLDFYSGRGLKVSSYDPRPLAIDFSNPIFEKTENVRSFVSLLKKYPRSMYAVKHGNPYGHVKLTDLFDFSAFEVWAVPPSRIALIPGLKATEAAFERLVDFIFYDFREGNVIDYGRAG